MKITRKQLRRIIAEETRLLNEDEVPSYPHFPVQGRQLQNALIALAERIVSEWKPGGMDLDAIEAQRERGEAIPDGVVVKGMRQLRELLNDKDSDPGWAAMRIMRILVDQRGVGERWDFPG